MQALTAEAIERYLNDLAFTGNYYRLKAEFQGSVYTQEDAFCIADNHLKGAYFEWQQDRDAAAALTRLGYARAICTERLYRDYLRKYNAAVSFFEGMLSSSGTPVQQNVHMQNLLLRVTACLQ